MIDVLLVLLIIFIMAVPMMRKAIDLQLPDPTPQPQTTQTPPDQIVLQVLPNSAVQDQQRGGDEGQSGVAAQGRSTSRARTRSFS